jgi:uncharacterized coiled-coil protein SlyX
MGASGDDIAVLCDAIRALLDRPIAAADESLELLEDTLTEGYARALTLEAERWRLERRIGELGADVASGPGGSEQELAALSGRLAQTTRRLTGLRALLEALRTRASSVRAGRALVTLENAGA